MECKWFQQCKGLLPHTTEIGYKVVQRLRESRLPLAVGGEFKQPRSHLVAHLCMSVVKFRWFNETPFFSGYMLHDLGYDVWLGNARGNAYSRKHANLKLNDKKYWMFRYRVTNQVVANLPLTSKQTFRFSLARPGQAKTEHLF